MKLDRGALLEPPPLPPKHPARSRRSTAARRNRRAAVERLNSRQTTVGNHLCSHGSARRGLHFPSAQQTTRHRTCVRAFRGQDDVPPSSTSSLGGELCNSADTSMLCQHLRSCRDVPLRLRNRRSVRSADPAGRTGAVPARNRAHRHPEAQRPACGDTLSC